MLEFHENHTSGWLRSTGLLALTLILATTNPLHADAAEPTEQDRHPGHLTRDAYINDIGTLLRRDGDNDGYFAGLSLTIDADTPYHDDRVYASIDMTGPDQITERLHTTADFTIYRSSATDEYRIDIDLVRNYQSAAYDLQIGLYDARDDRLLDRVDRSHFRNLRQLPLESEDFDLVPIPPSNDVNDNPALGSPNNNIRVEEHAGSSGITLTMLLIAGIACRRRRCLSTPH